MKKFSDYTGDEIVAMDNGTLQDAIRLEAISRGIEPPISLPQAIRQSEWVGFQIPAEAVQVWRLGSGYLRSPIAYLSESDAKSASKGAVVLGDVYRNGKCEPSIKIGEPIEVVMDWIGTNPSRSAGMKVEEYANANGDFDKLSEECVKIAGSHHQNAYNKKVNSERRKEYMRLAAGDEVIAKAFWEKTVSGTEWPSE